MSEALPRLFIPDGLVDAPRAPHSPPPTPAPTRPRLRAFAPLPEVSVRRPSGRVEPARPTPPAPPPELVWRCSLRAAQDIARHLDLAIPPDAPPDEIRAAADAAVAAARGACVLAGRSPQGSDVYALPRGIRRIGLVMASGADRPGVKTIVCALSPSKMEVEYPTAEGEPRDWQDTHLRGLLALEALDALADEAGPDSPAAAQRRLVRESTPAEVRALLGRTPS